jgi:hypothetical protein
VCDTVRTGLVRVRKDEGHEVAQVWGMEGSSGALNAISSVSSQLSTHRPTCEGPAEPDVLLRQDDGQDRVIR